MKCVTQRNYLIDLTQRKKLSVLIYCWNENKPANNLGL